ncbi:MAG: choice-of-anchor D domain-containing protein, partial [Patescibacteria group bacterium]|nr:choice-of-anchor D domain-containing protein [Patescibacteria group bacterium]
LYIGGFFSSVNGQTRNGLAAVNTSDGSLVSSFNPNVNSAVYSLALSTDNQTLYIGGSFTSVNGQTRNGLAALNTSNGSLVSSFNISVNSPPLYLLLSSDNSILYLAGDFFNVGGQIRGKLAAINIASNTVSSFNVPGIDDDVYSLALSSDNQKLYIGGTFTSVDNQPRNRLAAINTSDGSLINSFNPNINGAIYSLAISSDNQKLYIGGDFESVNGQTRNRLAAINTSDGSLVSGFDTNFDGPVYSIAFSFDNQTLYIGGSFNSGGGKNVNRLAAINNLDGSLVTNFNPNVNGAIYSLALSSDNQKLYIGGFFSSVNGQSRTNLAAINTSDGSLINSFNPNVNGAIYSLALSSDNQKLYIGGGFSSVNGQSRTNLAAINTSDGTLVSGFNISVNDGPVYSLALSSDDQKLYVGGDFYEFGGSSVNNLGAVNTTNGSVISSFNVDVNSFVNNVKLSSNNSILYISGSFNFVNGEIRTRLAAINTSDGSLVNSFNPHINNYINSFDLTSDDSIIYLGGIFNTINNQPRDMLGAVYTSNGNLINNFNPSPNSDINYVHLSSDNLKLYVSGIFSSIGGQQRPYFAVFSVPNLQLSTSSINFGDVAVNSSLNQSVNLINNGMIDLVINSIGNPNAPFSIIGNNCPSVLSSLSSCSLNIKFAPTSINNFNSSILISSNDPVNPNLNISLIGNGVGNIEELSSNNQQAKNGSIFKDELIFPQNRPLFKIDNLIKSDSGEYINSQYVDLTLYGGNSSWFQISNDPNFDPKYSSQVMNYRYQYKNWDICFGKTNCNSGTYKIYVRFFNLFKTKQETDSLSVNYLNSSNNTSNNKIKINIPLNFRFKKSLKYGSNDLEVKYLQMILNLDKETKLGDNGPGSFGNETTYFGLKTLNSIIKFQEKYKDEILKPLKLTKGTGYVGPSTIKKLNLILSEILNNN